jgi:SAM-dependent methyltransferase
MRIIRFGSSTGWDIMNARAELLERINRDIPKGVDWKRGAERYVASCFEKEGRKNIEAYSFNKPFPRISATNPTPGINECVHYLNNFANALALVKPNGGSRILDVACGGGWVSHFLTKMGYWTYGIDISEDFIDLARRRMVDDPTLGMCADEARDHFSVLDIEAGGLRAELEGTFDYVWLESCLHHFVDPVSALENLARALKPDGVIILLEFENREGAIKQEYLDVMREFDTLERPYARADLVAALRLAGLSEVEFVGVINGWFSPNDPVASMLGSHVIAGSGETNIALCAKKPGRLDGIFPHRTVSSNVTFGHGFYALENGFRWCAPSAELTVTIPTLSLDLRLHSMLPAREGRDQVIVAYGQGGEVARVSLTPKCPQAVMQLANVAAGQRITLHSTEAFRPSWTEGGDTRLLSFYLESNS